MCLSEQFPLPSFPKQQLHEPLSPPSLPFSMPASLPDSNSCLLLVERESLTHQVTSAHLPSFDGLATSIGTLSTHQNQKKEITLRSGSLFLLFQSSSNTSRFLRFLCLSQRLLLLLTQILVCFLLSANLCIMKTPTCRIPCFFCAFSESVSLFGLLSSITLSCICGCKQKRLPVEEQLFSRQRRMPKIEAICGQTGMDNKQH